MSDTQFCWYITVHAIQAAATLGVVLLALFGTQLRAWLWPPNLYATLADPEGEPTGYKGKDADGKEVGEITHYFHLRVANSRKWSPATDVSLHLVAIEEPGPDDKLETRWVGNVEFPWRHRKHYPEAQRRIGKSIDYDLCTLSQSGVRLYPIAAPNSFKSRWEHKCRFVACFEIHSTEIDVASIRIQIAWDGIWDEKNVKGHFRVEFKTE
ncbi:MAG: hypothetical protein ABSE79_04790 [Terriglobia bacterium]|jgi:hypothetical protein